MTDQCAGENVTVVVAEAPAGYGKSVLAAELVEAWGAVPIRVMMEQAAGSADLLAARLRAAVARAGFTDAAALMAGAGADPTGVVDAMQAALAGELCAIVIDDAHHASPDAGRLIDRMAAQIGPPGRLVVLARALPPGAERLRRAETLYLTATDLALREAETLQLCQLGFGLEVSADDARLLNAGTGGWTAATVLAASRAKRTDTPLRELAGLAREPGQLSASIAAILDEPLVMLGVGPEVLAQLAPLPLLDRELCALVTGEHDFFDRALALGLPITPAGEGWWELPGPVRDYLASLAGPVPAALLRAATHYEQHRQLGTALQLLLGAGEAELAARLLARADARTTESVNAFELLALFDQIPQSVADSHPWATFQVARACGVAAFIGPRSRLLARLDERVRSDDDPALRRAIDAELATDVLNGGDPAEAELLGRRVLDALTPREQFTRARALTVIGFALCWARDADGVLPEASLREASRFLDEASKLYLTLGYPEGASGAVAPRALWTELGAGRALAALEVIDAALADCAGRPLRVGRMLYYRAEILADLGRFDEADANSEEAERIGRRLGDDLIVASSHWARMNVASLRGDADRTAHHADQLEAERGDWWGVLGAEALATAADCLDRVGCTASAWQRLARAQEDPVRGRPWIAMSECALLARHGDPVLAEERLRTVHRQGIFPREYWRVTLLRAYAAWRRGESAAGALAARAFEEAARLGQPNLPLIRERDVTESLLALAVDTGSPDAAALESYSLPVAIGVLGRFEVSRGGRTLELRAGQGAQLLKLIVLSGGRIHGERAIEALWPDTDPAAGRNRLRTVLGRLREDAEDIVSRDGELLCLAPNVRVDLVQFQHEARQALALSSGDSATAVALARSAIARYRGDLLPHDLYEEWADTPREDARRTMLELLDRCAAAAAEWGDLDETRRMVERTIELAPYDDDRYLKVASILHEQGRRGAALSVLRRARSTLAALDVPLPRELRELEESLVA